MSKSLTDSPALGKSEPGYYAIVPRSVITSQTLSPGAKDLYALLDSFLGGRSHRVSNTRLANELKVSLRSITYYLQELEFAGLLIRKRTGRATIFTLINEARKKPKPLRKEVSFLSDTQNLADPQSNKPLVIKSKQTGEVEEAPLQLPSFSPAVAVKPFRLLDDEKRSQVVELNQALEAHSGFSLDLNSLKADFLEAVLEAFTQGFTPQEIAIRSSKWLTNQIQEKAQLGSPIRNPKGFLIKVLPSLLKEAELWSSDQTKAPNFIPSEVSIPHTIPFYDLFLDEVEPTPDPIAKAEAEALLRPFRQQAEILKKQGKL